MTRKRRREDASRGGAGSGGVVERAVTAVEAPCVEETAPRGRRKRRKKPKQQGYEIPEPQKTAALRACEELLLRLCNHSLSWPFLDPVDAEALGIPDYYDVISTPMDLKTIRRRMREHAYADEDAFAHDVRLVFYNAIKYNSAESQVGEMAVTLRGVFEGQYKRIIDKMVKEHRAKPKKRGNTAGSAGKNSGGKSGKTGKASGGSKRSKKSPPSSRGSNNTRGKAQGGAAANTEHSDGSHREQEPSAMVARSSSSGGDDADRKASHGSKPVRRRLAGKTPKSKRRLPTGVMPLELTPITTLQSPVPQSPRARNASRVWADLAHQAMLEFPRGLWFQVGTIAEMVRQVCHVDTQPGDDMCLARALTHEVQHQGLRARFVKNRDLGLYALNAAHRHVRLSGLHADACVQCGLVGELICCDSCPRVYHTACLPSNAAAPPSPLDAITRSPLASAAAWHCPECSKATVPHEVAYIPQGIPTPDMSPGTPMTPRTPMKVDEGTAEAEELFIQSTKQMAGVPVTPPLVDLSPAADTDPTAPPNALFGDVLPALALTA